MKFKNTAADKYETFARDVRVRAIRPTTEEESNGEAGWVMVDLDPGFVLEGMQSFIAHSVADLRRCLRKVTFAPEAS